MRKKQLISWLLIILLSVWQSAQAATVITSITDAPTATSLTALGYPAMAVKDSLGNIYIADTYNHQILKANLDPANNVSGITAVSNITTFIASGSLQYPSGLAVDANDTLYISDSGNHCIRHADSNGLLSTVAGTCGTPAFADGAAASSLFNSPRGLAINGNALYIADSGNGHVRLMDIATANVSTIAGSGAQSYNPAQDGGPAISADINAPYYLALSQDGKLLYVSGYFSQVIRQVDLTSGLIDTVAGNGQAGFSGDSGPATSAALNGPQGLAVDGNGNLYIADHFNKRIRFVDMASGIITTLAGTGTAGFSGDGGSGDAAQLNHPEGLFLDNQDNLLIADSLNQRIRNLLIDTVPPVIILNAPLAPFYTAQSTAPTDITIEAANSFIDAGATATDNVDSNATLAVNMVTNNPVIANLPGTYTISYDVSDTAGNAATQVIRNVTVIDTTPPAITITGGSPTHVEADLVNPYTDQGATAIDIVDGDVTANIITTNADLVDPTTLGDYIVTYDVSDAAGNTSTAERTVTVADTTPPVITLTGNRSLTADFNSTYSDQGATSIDSFDGDISAGITRTGSVNTSVPGSYTLTYTSTDLSGNTSVTTRTITVIDHLILQSTTQNSGGSLGFGLLLPLAALSLLRRRRSGTDHTAQEAA